MTNEIKYKLNCFKNLKTNQVIFSFEKSLGIDYVKKTPNTDELTENKHIPSIEIFDDCMLITIGKILHNNFIENHIEKIVMQNGQNVKIWDVKEKCKKGFPAVVSVPYNKIPKGETNFFVYCSAHGFFKLTQNFPSESYSFPAVMFAMDGTNKIIVRFLDLPDVVGIGLSKEEAYENAKKELRFAMICEDNKNVVPSALEEVRKNHPSAFMIEI
ncbi:MAG: hypothetical protein WCR30_01515 [Clostridia bacterium]